MAVLLVRCNLAAMRAMKQLTLDEDFAGDFVPGTVDVDMTYSLKAAGVGGFMRAFLGSVGRIFSSLGFARPLRFQVTGR